MIVIIVDLSFLISICNLSSFVIFIIDYFENFHKIQTQNVNTSGKKKKKDLRNNVWKYRFYYMN